MEKQELNRKLAEWAGFQTVEWINYPNRLPKIVKMPDGVVGSMELIDFTQSLDACFKWLVPKLRSVGIYQRNIAPGFKFFWTDVNYYTQGDYSINCEDENLALALCLAIEKLIDREEKEKSGI